jgi:hypothetical protein
MDFREYAAKEASELAARLTEAATAKAEQAARHSADEAQKVIHALREQVQSAVAQQMATEGQMKDAQGHAEYLQAELKSATERTQLARLQLDEAREMAERLEAARAELSVSRDEQAGARKAAEADLRDARRNIDALRDELANANKAVEQTAADRLASEEAAAAAHSQSQAAEAKLAAVTDLLKNSAARVKTLEQAQQDQARRVGDLESELQARRSAPPPAAAQVLDDLRAGFHALAGAATITDVLTKLVEQMAAQFPRVALFRVKKGHLQGEHHLGFDEKTDVGKLVLPLGMDSLPSRAASSGEIEMLAGDELKDSRRTPFTGTPTCAFAVPLVLAGDTLAVVYADDSGRPAATASEGQDLRARYAEAMQRYAVALLMRLTNELRALAELQRYAGSLLQEIEQMYEADLHAGKTGAELLKRLTGNLDYARSIYTSRAALEGVPGTLIEDELGALIDARKGTLFSRDLAAAAGLGERSAAEAS